MAVPRAHAFLSRHLRPLRAWIHAEFTLLLIVGLTAGALLGFAALGSEVLEGDTRAFDHLVWRALRAPGDPADPVGPWWLEVMFRDLTALGGVPVLALASASIVGYLLLAGRRSMALLVAVATGGGAALSQLLKGLFARPRPDAVAHVVQVYTSSFPSGHAMLSAVTYLTLAALLARAAPRRRLKVYLMLVATSLTALVGASRVYLGVHWLTDVVAGWCVGAAWASLCWLTALWLARRGRVEQERAAPSAPRD